MSQSSMSKGGEGFDFVCDCRVEVRSACEREPFYEESDGRRYCVLHYPGKEKSTDFKEALRRKVDAGDSNFQGVWFPDTIDFRAFPFPEQADFTYATFGAEANFSDVCFSADANFSFAIFSTTADFSHATFGARVYFFLTTFRADVRFSHATFCGDANFNQANFHSKADFSYATYRSKAYFSSTTFGANVNFSNTTFTRAYFTGATFRDYVRFAGDEKNHVLGNQSSLSFQYARVEKPDHASFHTLTLFPQWFINVDARKFDFTNVEWRGSIDQEIKNLKRKQYSAPHRLLAIVYRQLALNAEENHRYEEASKFRYWSLDARRRETWRGFAFWKLHWWYWALSGYGEKILRAFLALIGVWLVFSWFYTQVGFAPWEPGVTDESYIVTAKRKEVGDPLRLTRALTYSLGVMSLQKPEPRPLTNWAHTLVTLETILGPVQAALLALAIRRKFMR